MWHDDGDVRTWFSLDERQWEYFRREKCESVQQLIEFLIKLRIVRVIPPLGFDTASFTDRNWRP